MMRYLVVILLGATLWMMSGCYSNVDLEAEKEKVNQVMNQFDEALKTENMDLLAKIFAHDADMVIFGTDEPERWVGWDNFQEALHKQFMRIDTREFEVRNTVIKIHNTGDVAWFSKVIDWEIKVKDKVYRADDLRYTGVLEKRNGNWVFVQYHVSVPVEGQLVEY